MTSSAHLFAELETSDKDLLESERNNDEDEVEQFQFIVDFSQLAEGGTGNGNKCMEHTKDDGSKKVGTNTFGKLLVASTANSGDVYVGTITSRPLSISNSIEKQEQKT